MDHNELHLSAADRDSNGSSGGRRKGPVVWESVFTLSGRNR